MAFSHGFDAFQAYGHAPALLAAGGFDDHLAVLLQERLKGFAVADRLHLFGHFEAAVVHDAGG